jgi:hypothetical protein
MTRFNKILTDIQEVLLPHKTHSDIMENETPEIELMENETPEIELMEYKDEFLEMNIGSLRAIMQHAKNILDAMDDPSVKENLTEPWIQGKIAIT